MVNRIFSKRTFNSPVFRMAVLMIVVLVAGASLQDSFLTLRNVQSICKQLAEYGILAVAVFICMLSGGIDLSVVYIANLCAIVIGNILIATVPAGATLAQSWHLIVLALLVALGAGRSVGLFNGVLIGRNDVPAHAGHYGHWHAVSGGEHRHYRRQGPFRHSHGVYLHRPGQGAGAARKLYGVSALCTGHGAADFPNRLWPEGADDRHKQPAPHAFPGLNCPLDLMRVYTISGMFAAVSGAISIMRMSSAKPDYGTSYIMFSILICVFGGTHPDGGKGACWAWYWPRWFCRWFPR